MGDTPWPNNHSTRLNFIYFESSLIFLNIFSYLIFLNSWDKTNNPEPWNKLSPSDQYKVNIKSLL